MTRNDVIRPFIFSLITLDVAHMCFSRRRKPSDLWASWSWTGHFPCTHRSWAASESWAGTAYHCKQNKFSPGLGKHLTDLSYVYEHLSRSRSGLEDSRFTACKKTNYCPTNYSKQLPSPSIPRIRQYLWLESEPVPDLHAHWLVYKN